MLTGASTLRLTARGRLPELVMLSFPLLTPLFSTQAGDPQEAGAIHAAFFGDSVEPNVQKMVVGSIKVSEFDPSPPLFFSLGNRS